MAPSNKTEIATRSPNLPEQTDDDFSAYAGAGMEHVTASDMMVPRLGILQKLSPQLDKREAVYIPGATEGMICDLGTLETFPEGVLFLPVHYAKVWLEWYPRASGKGIAAIHTDSAILEQTTPDERRRPVLPNGNYVAETAQFFGLNLTANRRRCFIPMASTQLKKARRWITLATGEKLQRSDGSEFTAPMFYRTYELSTADEHNSEGSWVGWVINRGAALPELDLSSMHFGKGASWKNFKQDAVDFFESLRKGEAQADLSTLAEAEVASGEATM